jgi:hypothetical protein
MTRTRLLYGLLCCAALALTFRGWQILVYGAPAPRFEDAAGTMRRAGSCTELDVKPGTFVTPARFVTAYRTELGLGERDELRPRAAPWPPDWLERWRNSGGLVSRSYERVHDGKAVPGSDLALQLRRGFVVGALACGDRP